MKKYKNKMISGVIIALLLTLVFLCGGDAPGTTEPEEVINTSYETTSEKTELTSVTEESEDTFTLSDAAKGETIVNAGETPVKQTDETASKENQRQNTDNTLLTSDEKEEFEEHITKENQITDVENGNKEYSEKNGKVTDQKTVRDQYLTEAVPEGKPLPLEPQDAVISDKELTCILSVRCDTILSNIARLDKEKTELVPKDGIIFAEKEVTFYEGESVFNLLLREMKRNKIHMEFENVPIYNSAYIEGIANIYEFDCGELSGWIYKVNGWFPNYGCSRYQLKEGDRVEWVYTCDLGTDVLCER